MLGAGSLSEFEKKNIYGIVCFVRECFSSESLNCGKWNSVSFDSIIHEKGQGKTSNYRDYGNSNLNKRNNPI